MIDITQRKREDLLLFLDDLYVPKKHRDEYLSLMKYARVHHSFYELEEKDSFAKDVVILVIRTIGKGVRETFAGFDMKPVKVGKVSSTYATILVPGQFSTRIFVKSVRSVVVADITGREINDQ